jgi:nucleotide-binding universal stress UspA family protein
MTFKNILLAIDRTEKADQVLEQGISLATQYNACLTLVHCIHDVDLLAAASVTPPVGVGMPWTGGSVASVGTPLATNSSQDLAAGNHIDRERQAAENWLKKYFQKAYDAGCEETGTIVRMGKPGDCICKLANELGSDLIIVGRKDRSGLEELLLGSVSSDVVHHANCAVLVAQT